MKKRRGAALVLFKKKEKFDAQVSIRLPTSLLQKLDKIAEKEGAESLNSARVDMLATIASIMEWVQGRWDRIQSFMDVESLEGEDVPVKLMELGLEAWEKRQKR